jgi:hypothetical protein
MQTTQRAVILRHGPGVWTSSCSAQIAPVAIRCAAQNRPSAQRLPYDDRKNACANLAAGA